MTQADPGSTPGATYAIAGPRIVVRLFEDELTLINLDSGEYFAAGGAVPMIWEWLDPAAPIADVLARAEARYVDDGDTMRADIERLLQDLVAHGLVVQAQPGSSPVIEPERSRQPWPGVWLEAYGDMKELLLLDPIHDVGEGAWPPAPDRSAP